VVVVVVVACIDVDETAVLTYKTLVYVCACMHLLVVCAAVQDLRPDITSVITSLSAMDKALKKVYDMIGGLPHYTAVQQQVMC